MKVVNFLTALFVVLVMPLMANAYDHPEANFGDYGIKHFNSINQYQEHYIGQTVIYLPANRGSNGNYFDENFFLKKGGEFNTEYTITKITGNDKKMTFNLESGKSKVKMVINNEDLYYSYGKDTYCITDNYTVPLFLVGKFNEDKKNYIGKVFGGRFEITDARIEKVEWHGDDSHKTYPQIQFVVTDKTDGKQSFVDAANIKDINDLGKEFSNPSFKCRYNVIGIGTKTRYSYTLHGNEKTKMYTVKNSINGKTKEVEAYSAKTDAFKGDDSGRFFASLSKVEKPSNAAVRYGSTTTITDKDITKFSYVDNFIDITIFASTDQFHFVLRNVSDNTIKVVWNEAVFVDVDGSTSKVMHSGVKYSQREGDQPASTIIKGAKLEDLAAPTANVYYSDVLKEWTSYSLYRNADKKAEGQTIRLMLPIQVKEVINEYIFEFGLNYVYDHPEYLADK